MQKITKSFSMGKRKRIEVLHGINLSVKSGEFISIVGQSGSGKTTLMNIIGGLDCPTSGRYLLEGVDIGNLNGNQLSDIRNRKIGFVFQTFNLIPRSSALRNVELPMLYAGLGDAERKERARELLFMFGLGNRVNHLPNELSGGQKQRVAIARSIANDPAIILADEPTGALDTKTGRMVMDIFHKLHEKQNKTIVLITHNERLADETERILTIEDGYFIDEKIT
ncbi:MAG: ABC transporter ATP-binding protein [Clostridiales bacterium]|jgi:putative ABC transport system ATP-binding protein|nr:ABC transporter ATP-binding protein [Clostridiales bacterium]